MRRLILCLMIVASLFIDVSPVLAACDGYVVARGDTLSKIARENNTTWPELARLNRIVNPNLIYVGQCIKFPTGSGSVSSTQTRQYIKGIAMADPSHPEDLDTLNVSWWYMWGEYCPINDARCVNMVRVMQLPQVCYATMLIGNEPNAIEPYGAPVTPTDAVAKVRAIEAQCPQSKLVVGNVSTENWGNGTGRDWLLAFLKAYPDFRQVLGVHCYTQHSGQWCVDQLKSLRSIYSGEMWVTEFGVLDGDVVQFGIVINYVAANFTRYAVYTNRQPHTGEGWEIATGVELVNGDGTLSPIGRIYAEK